MNHGIPLLTSPYKGEEHERGMNEDIVYSEVASSGLPFGVYIAIGIAAVIALALLIGLAVWIKRKLSRPEMYGLSREEVQKRWQRVRDTSKMNGQMGMKLALVEADVLLDAALKSLVMPGDTLGERLKVACYKYPKLKDVWWAHKLRNQLVHDHEFRLSDREVGRALDEFEKALKVLNVL